MRKGNVYFMMMVFFVVMAVLYVATLYFEARDKQLANTDSATFRAAELTEPNKTDEVTATVTGSASAAESDDPNLMYNSKLDLAPQCPYYKKPTDRISLWGTTTLVYYPVIYKADGTIEETGHNTTTGKWKCLNCGKEFTWSGTEAK